MARIVFLGACAALPTADSTNTALAVLPEDGETQTNLLIDCGGDVYRALLRAGIGPDAISDLLITHAHIDHIGSLPSLIESWRLSGRQAPLRIWALPEVLEVAQRLIAAFDFELTLDSWTYAMSFASVEQGQSLTLAGMPARVARMDHTVPSVGVRLTLAGGDLAYTSDTQPNDHVQELAQGARLFISECTFLDAYAAAARTSRHSTALEAGREAAQCGAETLALVHLGHGWPIEQVRVEAAQAFSGRIVIPSDGDRLTF